MVYGEAMPMRQAITANTGSITVNSSISGSGGLTGASGAWTLMPGDVGTPCKECAALVRDQDEKKHQAWHSQLRVLEKLVRSIAAEDVSEMAAGLVLLDDDFDE